MTVCRVRRQVCILLMIGALCATFLLAGCDLPEAHPVAPDYNMTYIEWSTVARAPASLDATAAAMKVLAQSGDPEIRAFGLSGSVESTGGLGVALMPHYRPGPPATGRGVYDSLVPTGIIDVRLFRRAPRLWLRSFLIKRGSRDWEFNTNGLDVYWDLDMDGLAKLTSGTVEYRYLYLIGRLNWYLVRTPSRDFAYPSGHQGMVLIAPQGSDRWTAPDPGAYPPEVVYDQVR